MILTLTHAVLSQEFESNEESSQQLDNATAKIYKKILHMESIINLIEEAEMKKAGSGGGMNNGEWC